MPGRSSPPPLPIGFAHRGGAERRADQNTLGAFRRARELGATGIESDVALTADGVPVLVHPGITSRLRRPVSSLRREQLASRVPSLEEVYRECGPSVDVALDMTAPAAAAVVVDIARRHGDPSRLWLTYWRVATVAAWRQRYPDVRLVFPTLMLRSRTAAEQVARLRGAGVDAVNLYHRTCSPGRVAVIHDAGMLVFGWGARSGSAAARVLRSGADGVFCDDTVGMVAALGAEGRRRAALSAAR
jgi:glycerophosphoryl diester phosphodiesterase